MCVNPSPFSLYKCSQNIVDEREILLKQLILTIEFPCTYIGLLKSISWEYSMI